MGMTIAEPIQTLEYLRDSGVFPFQYKGVLYTVESIDVAIETLHKYQKIKQIVEHWINEDEVGMSDYWMGRIKEVTNE